MQWCVILINFFVHIVMYLYYALHAIGIDVWWKKYLTVTQIIQFVIALAACAGGLGPRLLNYYGYKQFPHCWGSFPGAFFGIGILLTCITNPCLPLQQNCHTRCSDIMQTGTTNTNCCKELPKQTLLY
jgi:hypothetical protein